MERKRRRLPTVAIALGVFALIVGVAGSAVAGPDALTSISKNKTKKIANKQAKKQINKRTPWETGDIADSAITSNKIATDAVSSSKLADESVKSDELGEINTRSDDTTIAPQTNGTASVSCDNGEKVVSGGWEGPPFDQNNNTGVIIYEDQRSNDGWTASAFNFSSQVPAQLTVYAYCLEESG